MLWTQEQHLSQSIQKVVLEDKPSDSLHEQISHNTPSLPSLSSSSLYRAGNCRRRPLEELATEGIPTSEPDSLEDRGLFWEMSESSSVAAIFPLPLPRPLRSPFSTMTSSTCLHLFFLMLFLFSQLYPLLFFLFFSSSASSFFPLSLSKIVNILICCHWHPLFSLSSVLLMQRQYWGCDNGDVTGVDKAETDDTEWLAGLNDTLQSSDIAGSIGTELAVTDERDTLELEETATMEYYTDPADTDRVLKGCTHY